MKLIIPLFLLLVLSMALVSAQLQDETGTDEIGFFTWVWNSINSFWEKVYGELDGKSDTITTETPKQYTVVFTPEDNFNGYKIESITGNESIYYDVDLNGDEICLIPKFIGEKVIEEVIIDEKTDESISKEVIYKQPIEVKLTTETKDISYIQEDKGKFCYTIPDNTKWLKLGEESIIITGDTSYSSINNNVTQERGFAHLTISTAYPYSNLVLYMPFDVNHGTNTNITYDYSINNSNGVAKGNVNWNTTNRYGGYINMDGITNRSYINLSRDIIRTTNFTISVWANNSGKCGGTSGYCPLFSQRDDTGGNNKSAIILMANITQWWGVQLRGSSNSTMQQIFAPIQPRNEWHHYVVSYNTSNIMLYMDGVLVNDTRSIQYGNFTSSVDHRLIGREASNTGSFHGAFNGSIDEVMVFNTSLNSSDILAIYNNQSARFFSSGTQVFNNTKVGTAQNEDRLNISIPLTQTLLNTNISVNINGTEYNLTNGNISNLQFTTNPNNLNITFRYQSNANNFYSPLIVGNITLNSWSNKTVFYYNGTLDDQTLIIINVSETNFDDIPKLLINDNISFDVPGHTAELDTFVYMNFTLPTSYNSINVSIWSNLSSDNLNVVGIALFNFTNGLWTNVSSGGYETNTRQSYTTTIFNDFVSNGKIIVMAYERSSIDLKHWVDLIDVNASTVITDTVFPTFSNFYDDNSTILGNGIAYFNVSVINTNGTVRININNTNYEASNTSFNNYNASVNLSGGNYLYNWTAWGNGTDENINTSGNRYYTINTSGDATPPNITFNSQIPADISSVNIWGMGLNITYNITDSSALDLSTINLTHWSNSTMRNIITFINGTDLGIDTDIYDSNTSLTFLWNLGDDEVYPGTYNLHPSTFHNTIHTAIALPTASDYIKTQLLNITNTTQYNFLEIMVNASVTANILKFFYCNSSYSAGNLNINSNCIIAATWSPTPLFNYTENQSSYKFVTIFINTTLGTISGIKVTPTSYFLIQGTGGGGSRYVYTIPQTARNGATQTSGNNGISWTDQTYTVDAHLHQFSGNSSLYYYVCASDVLNNQNCSSTRSDLFDLGGLPPTSPFVYNPIAQTYSNSITINYTASLSPNDYPITMYNISLANVNGVFNKTIISNNSLNLSYIWNTSLISNGNYTIRVEATDSNGLSNFGFSEEFEIYHDTEYPVFSNFITTPTNNSQYRNDNIWFNVTISSTNGTAGIEFNGTNYSLSNISSVFNKTLNSLSGGTYHYYFWAFGNGTSKNYNITNMKSYVITQNNTYTLNIAITPSNSVTYPTQTTATGSGCPELICNLYMDLAIKGNPNTVTLGVGTYNYSYSTTGSVNYSSNVVSDILTVNKATGIVNTYINHLRADKTINNDTTVEFNSTLVTGLGNIKFFMNYSIWNTGTSPLYNNTNLTTLGTYLISTVYDGNQNYTNADENWTLTVQLTTPPSNVTTTSVSTPQCKYKKFGYYNLRLPWMRQENCL